MGNYGNVRSSKKTMQRLKTMTMTKNEDKTKKKYLKEMFRSKINNDSYMTHKIQNKN